MRVLAALRPVIDLMYPPRCPLCGAPVAAHGGLCVDCWGTLAIPGEPACSLCQRPLGLDEGGTDIPREGGVCAPCMAAPPRHDGIAAATLYNETSRKLVLMFKHGRRVTLADLLARLMVARLPPMEGDWVVVPVPLHRWRLWHRGFNQSALLAARIAAARGHSLVVDGLVRTRRTPSLGGLGRRARARALSSAIIANSRRSSALKGACVLLVDDVMTSGATTDACVRALHRAGAAKVRIACFARVLDEATGIHPAVAVDTRAAA